MADNTTTIYDTTKEPTPDKPEDIHREQEAGIAEARERMGYDRFDRYTGEMQREIESNAKDRKRQKERSRLTFVVPDLPWLHKKKAENIEENEDCPK